jgi:hypothetical protein
VVVAEVSEVHRVEHVGRATASAVLGVGGVRHARQRERVIVDAEEQCLRLVAAEVGDQRVVGVENEPVARVHAGPPASCRRSARALP